VRVYPGDGAATGNGIRHFRFQIENDGFYKYERRLGAHKPELTISEVTDTSVHPLADDDVQMDIDHERGDPVVLVERIDRATEDTTHVSVSRNSSLRRNRSGLRSSKQNLDEESAVEDCRSVRLGFASESMRGAENEADSSSVASSYVSPRWR